MQALRDMTKDDRMWCIAARVALHDDNDGDHYAISSSGQLLVSVKTLQHSIPIWAICSGGDKVKNGVWTVPALGTEVIIQCDDGDLEGDCFLVGLLGVAPSGLEPGKTLVLGDDAVEARSPGGSAQSLAFQAKLNALENKVNSLIAKYNIHTHTGGSVSGGAVTTIATLTLETVIQTSTGTEILKGE